MDNAIPSQTAAAAADLKAEIPVTIEDVQGMQAEGETRGGRSPRDSRKRDFRQAEVPTAKILSQTDSESRPEIQRAKFPALRPEAVQPVLEKIDYLRDVDLVASVELGSTVLTVEKILSLDIGSIIELDQSVGDQIRILINNNPYALGEVVVIGEKFGVRITKILNEGLA